MVRFLLAAFAAFLTFFRAAIRCFSLGISLSLMAFEVLDGAFMCFGLLQRPEGAKVAALACLWIFLA
jgi:hypothetical protein